MDMAYLTGQRPANLLKFNKSDIRNGELCLVQNKTGKIMRIAIEGEPQDLKERILSHEYRSEGCDALLQEGKSEKVSPLK